MCANAILFFRYLLRKQYLLFFILYSINSQSQTFCNDFEGTSCDNCPPYSVFPNPNLTVSCEGNINVILVIDESNSIGIAGSQGDVQEGVEAFLQELECTPVNVAIIEFGSVANYIVESYTPVADVIAGMTNYFNGTGFNGQTYNPNQGSLGGTNWQAALMRANSLHTADLLLMFTDGVPTAYSPDANSPGSSYDFCGSGNTSQQTEIYNAVQLANTIKSNGTHMFILGVGSINSNLMNAISGNDQYGLSETIATADYYIDPNFDTLSECFASLANSLCPIGATDSVSYICYGETEGTITIDLADNVQAPYTFTLNGPGHNNTIFNTSDDPFNINVSQLGNYTVTIEASGTCFGEATLPISVQARDEISVIASISEPVCPDATEISLNAISGDAVSWYWVSDGSSIINNPIDQNPTASGFVNGEIFTVSITDNNGCMDSDSITFAWSDDIDPPIIACPDLPAICNDEFPSLTATWTDNCSAGGIITLDAPTRIEQSLDGCSEIGYYDFEVYDDYGNLGIQTCTLIREIEIIGSCETAFAKASEGSQCFIPDFRRWGWTNHFTSYGEYTMDLWAGAAHCDISRGTLVGTVTINYSESQVSVTYNIADGYTMNQAHVYLGCEPYPNKRGRITVAPGQFLFNPSFDGNVQNYTVVVDNESGTNRGGIYVIAHAVVCEFICQCYQNEEEVENETEFLGGFDCRRQTGSIRTLNINSWLRVYQNSNSEILKVNYELDVDTGIKVEVLNMRGTVLKREIKNNYKAGSDETIQMDMTNVTDHVLFVRLTTKNGVKIKKIIMKKN
jgi:hypothetical protein